jgi:flagellar FliL protein
MSNKLMFILVTVLLVLTIGLSAGFFMMWSKLSTLNLQANPVDNTATGPDQTAALGTLFSLDTFIVNLADQEHNRYLRVAMDLEIVASTDAAKLTERLPQIRDRILMILPSKQFSDIAGMEGKTALRDEIIRKLNGLFPTKVITNIFFTEFVVQ